MQKLLVVLAVIALQFIGSSRVNAQSATPPDLIWQKVIPGTVSWGGTKVVETNDHGFAMIGSHFLGGVGDDTAATQLTKTDSVGNVLWQTPQITNFTGWILKKTHDGGYLIGGHSDRSYGHLLILTTLRLVRMDSLGTILWDNTYTYDSSNNNDGLAIESVQADGFGYVLLSGNQDPETENEKPFLMAVNDYGGTMTWKKEYDLGYWRQQPDQMKLIDGGLMFNINSYSTDSVGALGIIDEWGIMKVNLVGDSLWYSPQTQGVITSFAQSKLNSSVLITSVTCSYTGTCTDHSASVVLNGGSGTDFDSSAFVLGDGSPVLIPDADSEYVELNDGASVPSVGTAYEGCVQVRQFSEEGLPIWTKIIGPTYPAILAADTIYHPCDMIVTSDSGYVVSGFLNLHGTFTSFLLKLKKSKKVTPIIKAAVATVTQEAMKLYPNPAKDEVTLVCQLSDPAHFELFNTVGQIVLQQEITDTKTQISVRDLPPGTYIYRCTTTAGSTNGKLQKL